IAPVAQREHFSVCALASESIEGNHEGAKGTRRFSFFLFSFVPSRLRGEIPARYDRAAHAVIDAFGDRVLQALELTF
ncbi:MAG TPA: hypothetical protein VN809_05955, partial [Telmatospirillum sp.]|nr:hypothetical protein [Telmatospirillum sp.]